MEKHEVIRDGRKFIIEGNFIDEALKLGVKPYYATFYEDYSLHAEVYMQLYNESIENDDHAEADFYSRLYRTKISEIKNLIP